MFPSRHFTLADFHTTSHPSLQSTATGTARENLDTTARVADRVWDVIGPFTVTSGYRAPALNKAVGGSPTSDHPNGRGFDLKSKMGLSAEQVATKLWQSGLSFDQVIWYDPKRGGHVHIGYRSEITNRGQFKHAPDSGGYLAWTPSSTGAQALLVQTARQPFSMALPATLKHFAERLSQRLPWWGWALGGTLFLSLFVLLARRRSGRGRVQTLYVTG